MCNIKMLLIVVALQDSEIGCLSDHESTTILSISTS